MMKKADISKSKEGQKNGVEKAAGQDVKKVSFSG